MTPIGLGPCAPSTLCVGLAWDEVCDQPHHASTHHCVKNCNCSMRCAHATDRGWVNGSRGLTGGGFTVYPSPSTTTTFSTLPLLPRTTLLPPTTSSQPSQKIFKKHFWTYPPGLKGFNSPGLMGDAGQDWSRTSGPAAPHRAAGNRSALASHSAHAYTPSSIQQGHHPATFLESTECQYNKSSPIQSNSQSLK